MSVNQSVYSLRERSSAPPGPASGPQGGDARNRDTSKKLVWSLPGFGPMTRITTSFGEVHAQALRERDLVRTKQGDYKPIVWIDRLILEEEFLGRHPDAQPILIKAGSLGRGLPRADVVVSPRQEISGEMLPGTGPYTAAKLLSRPGVFRKTENTVTYTMFHCGSPQTVLTEKIWVNVAP